MSFSFFLHAGAKAEFLTSAHNRKSVCYFPVAPPSEAHGNVLFRPNQLHKDRACGMWARACPRDVRREAVTFLCAGQEGGLCWWPGVMDGVGECMGHEQWCDRGSTLQAITIWICYQWKEGEEEKAVLLTPWSYFHSFLKVYELLWITSWVTNADALRIPDCSFGSRQCFMGMI